MDLNIIWLEPWGSLTTDPEVFENELYQEIGTPHILYGKKVFAVGKRNDCDDILFHVKDQEFSFAVVHLSYSSTVENNPWPITKLYKDLDSWINECMLVDNTEHML